MASMTWLCSIVLIAIYGSQHGAQADLQTTDQLASLNGRVYLPPRTGVLAHTRVIVTTDGGMERTAFCLSDGTFSMPQLASGQYLLDVAVMGYMFPQYRVDVSGARTTLTAMSTKLVVDSNVLMPLGIAKYYQQRKPFDIIAMVKSPYGIMGVLAVLAIFVFPMMKVDPEEYKQMQEEMKDSPLAGLMGMSQGAQTSKGPPVTTSAKKQRR